MLFLFPETEGERERERRGSGVQSGPLGSHVKRRRGSFCCWRLLWLLETSITVDGNTGSRSVNQKASPLVLGSHLPLRSGFFCGGVGGCCHLHQNQMRKRGARSLDLGVMCSSAERTMREGV